MTSYVSLLLWRRTRTSTCQKGSVRKGWNPSRTSPESSYQDLSRTCACEQISLYEAWNAQVLQVAKICISSTFTWQGVLELDHNNCIILGPSTSWGKSLAPLSFELWEPGIAAIATDSAFQFTKRITSTCTASPLCRRPGLLDWKPCLQASLDSTCKCRIVGLLPRFLSRDETSRHFKMFEDKKLKFLPSDSVRNTAWAACISRNVDDAGHTSEVYPLKRSHVKAHLLCGLCSCLCSCFGLCITQQCHIHA